MFLDQTADAVKFPVPAGCAYNHVLAGLHTGFDVGDDRVRGGEVNDDVNVAKLLESERGTGDVFFGTESPDVMLALDGDFGDQRSGFASAENQEFHSAERPLTAEIAKRAAKNAKKILRGLRVILALFAVKVFWPLREYFRIQFGKESLMQALDYLGHFVLFNHERQID